MHGATMKTENIRQLLRRRQENNYHKNNATVRLSSTQGAQRTSCSHKIKRI